MSAERVGGGCVGGDSVIAPEPTADSGGSGSGEERKMVHENCGKMSFSHLNGLYRFLLYNFNNLN